VIISGERLSIYDVYEIAVNKKAVKLDQTQIRKVGETYKRVQKWGSAKYPIYGVNTGFGELIHVIIPPHFKSELQRNLVRSHAAGGGEPFTDEVVRAMMTARLNCLMKGYSGVSTQAVELMQQFLNSEIHPVVLQQGSLGASGDLAPLAHLTLPLIGDGYVRVKGQVRKSAEVLQELNLKPLELGFKEALALINGTSGMTGAASLSLVKAYRLLKLAILASADIIQCLNASTRPFDKRGNALKNHSGQNRIAGVLRNLLSGSKLTREHGDIMRTISQQAASISSDVVDTTVFLQNAYTLRCIPQILGPVLDTLNFCKRIVEEEINSANDNPLIFEVPEETFHGGHFHGQYVAMVSDYMNIALTEIGVLAERQVNRLLDPHLNGSLPPFLAHDQAGLFCGFAGGQYLATSIASENLDLATPSSVKSIPSNGQNQDVVSMGLNSARKSLQLCENVTTILAVLVSACYQASNFIEPEKFSSPVRQLHEELSRVVSIYEDRVPITELFSQVRDFLTSERALAYIDDKVDFDKEYDV
jgi:histidine ammonia-lyase/tyrosine ammonia-lyase